MTEISFNFDFFWGAPDSDSEILSTAQLTSAEDVSDFLARTRMFAFLYIADNNYRNREFGITAIDYTAFKVFVNDAEPDKIKFFLPADNSCIIYHVVEFDPSLLNLPSHGAGSNIRYGIKVDILEAYMGVFRDLRDNYLVDNQLGASVILNQDLHDENMKRFIFEFLLDYSE